MAHNLGALLAILLIGAIVLPIPVAIWAVFRS
jgi:uncharacterized membrane protein